MRNTLVVAASVGCLWCASAAAEKFTAKTECGKSDPEHVLPAGDRPDHNLAVEAAKCGWSMPLEIAGDKTVSSVATQVDDISGSKIHFHGVNERTMQSGDKVALPYQGGGTSKDNREWRSKGTFTFADGTGKLKGIKGQGTFSCKSAGEGVNCDVVGEYEVAK